MSLTPALAAQAPGASPVERLDLLQSIPLPGEDRVISERPRRDEISPLIGRLISQVTAPDAPPGFEPEVDADIPLGIKLNRRTIRSAVRRLWETGKYRDVRISARPLSADTVALRIDVALMLRIARLEIRGNSALGSDVIEKVVQYAPGRTIIPDQAVLRGIRQHLIDHYRQSGYAGASAAISILTTEEPGKVALIVDIDEGEPERYASITVAGLPEDVPENLLGIKKGTVRDPAAVEKKIERFLTELSDRGYKDAEAAPFVETRINAHQLTLRIPLAPGLKTDIAFVGNKHFYSRDLERFMEKKGPFRTDPKTIHLKQRQLVTHLQSHGFLFSKVSAERRCTLRDTVRAVPVRSRCGERTLRQTIVFHIDEGPNVEMLTVRFEGNERYSDQALEEELFAFITEKNLDDEMFQPVNSATLNDLGLSEKQIRQAPERRGLKAPRYRRSRVYVPEQYHAAAEHLTGIYQEQGFLGAKVTDTCDMANRGPLDYRETRFSPIRIPRDITEPTEGEAPSVPCVFLNLEKKQLLAVVRVEEGAQTTVDELIFEGNRSVASRELAAASGIAVASPYNAYQLKQAARKLTQHYRDQGYMFAEVGFRNAFSENMRRARVVFEVSEGPKARVGLIRVEGGETTRPELVREVVSLEAGDVITPEALETAQIKLMNLGIFNSVTVQMVSPEIPAPVKSIRVQVAEAPPQYLELRWGIATVEGLRSSLEYGFNNIAGLALGATLRARANYRLFFIGDPDFEARYEAMTLMEQLEHHLLLGIGSPHFPGTRGLLGWGIDVIKERINKPGFSASRLTTFLRLNSKLPLTMRYPQGLVVSARTGVELNLDISSGQLQRNPYLQQYLRLPQGRSAFYVVGLNVSVDLRDSPFNPTEGFYFSVGGDWVYSLPLLATPSTITQKSNLIRALATASGYVPIFNTGVVFALSFTAGYIFHLTNASITWPDRYFYAGGIDTLRGFPVDSLVPEDVYDDWKGSLDRYGEDVDALLKYRGGESMFIARAELRYPLTKGFLGALFAELGNLWRDRERTEIISLSPTAELNLRPVAGVGIRYQTPLGPISFDLGINLYRRPFELPFSWYISIGTAF